MQLVITFGRYVYGLQAMWNCYFWVSASVDEGQKDWFGPTNATPKGVLVTHSAHVFLSWSALITGLLWSICVWHIMINKTRIQRNRMGHGPDLTDHNKTRSLSPRVRVSLWSPLVRASNVCFLCYAFSIFDIMLFECFRPYCVSFKELKTCSLWNTEKHTQKGELCV